MEPGGFVTLEPRLPTPFLSPGREREGARGLYRPRKCVLEGSQQSEVSSATSLCLTGFPNHTPGLENER